MEHCGVLHHPVHIADAGAAEQIGIIVSCVIVPDDVTQIRRPPAVQGVQHILVREEQFFAMFSHIVKYLFGIDLISCHIEIHQKNP